MGYVAVKGGQDAIENANRLVEYFRWKGKTQPIEVDQARTQMRLAIDRAMGEGALYAPEHAALALLQVEGDSFEAAFHLRAYRATLQRRYYSETLNLLCPSWMRSSLGEINTYLEGLRGQIDPDKLHGVCTYSKVIDIFLREGLMSQEARPGEDRRVVDVTREAIKFPVPRSAVLQMLARAETGSLMCMAYSTQRGFGVSHGTVGELRVGEVPVRLRDSRRRLRYVGKIKVTETEMVGSISVSKKGSNRSVPQLSVGYGLCFGHNESKGISMGMVESALRSPDPNNPANNQEFVLYHTEAIESYGFVNHLKLPHYVTFQAGLQEIRDILRINSDEAEVVVLAGEDESEDDDD